MRRIVVGLAVPLATVGLLLGLGGAADASPISSHSAGAPLPPPGPPARTVGDSYAVLASGDGITTSRAKTSALPSSLPDYSGTIVIAV